MTKRKKSSILFWSARRDGWAGLRRTTGNRVCGNPVPRVRISLSPPRKKHTFVYQDDVCFFQWNPPSSEEIHLRWMKSLRDEICLAAGDEGGFNFIWNRKLKISSKRSKNFIVHSTISFKRCVAFSIINTKTTSNKLVVFCWCRWSGSNRYGIATTGFWVQHVCQFHHTGVQQMVLYHIVSKKSIPFWIFFSKNYKK